MVQEWNEFKEKVKEIQQKELLEIYLTKIIGDTEPAIEGENSNLEC